MIQPNKPHKVLYYLPAHPFQLVLVVYKLRVLISQYKKQFNKEYLSITAMHTVMKNKMIPIKMRIQTATHQKKCTTCTINLSIAQQKKMH